MVDSPHATVDHSSRGDGQSPARKQHQGIFDVPPELLVIIFQLCLPSRDAAFSEVYMRDLYTLQLVSKSWRNLLDATPSIWAVISSRLPYHVNSTNALKSCDAPLIIHFDRVQTASGDACLQFLRLLDETRYRWKVLSMEEWLEEYFSPYIVHPYFASPAPLLEAVFLSRGVDYPCLHLLGGETHNIRYLHLDNVAVQWSRLSFHRLKSLCLDGSVGEEITMNIIFEILANNPGLERLSLNLRMDPSTTPSPPTICLLHLESLVLGSHLAAPVLDYLLRHIEAPHCQQLSISLLGSGTGIDKSFILDDSLRPFEPLFQRLHKKCGASNLLASPSHMHWGGTRGDGSRHLRFSIMADHVSYTSYLRWIERVLDTLDPGGLEVKIYINDSNVLDNPENMSILQRLRSVTHIHSSVDPRNGRWIIKLLQNPSVPDSRHPGPTLPLLKELMLDGTDVTTEEILQIAQTRSACRTQESLNVPDIEIKFQNPHFCWSMPCRDFDFTTVSKIHAIGGVILRFRTYSLYDMCAGVLAAVWDEELGEPAWG